MAFDASQFMYSSGSSSAYAITNSVRFDEARTCSLALTPGTAGDRQTFTFSTWVKFNFAGNDNGILHAREDANDRFFFGQSSNYLFITYYVGGTEKNIRTTALYRDYNSWYHVVLRVDTTAGTAGDRMRIYVNGVLQHLHTGQMPTQNDNLAVSDTVAHKIGQRVSNNDYKADYYLAETVFIDGQTLAPTSFGEADDDYGHWKPIDVSGLTFGDEGYYLNYQASGVGTASSSTIGADVSGNTNHFTSTNVAATDQTIDSPTNNFATFNRLRGLGPTMFEGNLLTETSTNTVSRSVDTNFEPPSGKWYVEVLIKVDGANSGQNATHVGVANPTFITGNEFKGHSNGVSYCQNGQKGLNNASLSDYGATYTNGDVIGIAYDTDNDNITFIKNNAAQPQLTSGFDISNGRVVVATNSSSATGQRYGINFGQDSTFAGQKTAGGNSDANGIGDFLYAVPSGFLALCTENLPEADVVPSEYFNTTLWTGNNTDDRNITGVGFRPNMVWIKSRGTTNDNMIFDSIRGVGKYLRTNSTDAEDSNANTLQAFASDGFQIGDDSRLNTNNDPVSSWNWYAATSVSGNSTGAGDDVAYTGSVNTDAGFSIIKYGGNASTGHQVPHHLGVVPDMIWIRNLTTQSWNCWWPNTSQGATKVLQLDNGSATSSQSWINNTMPTATVVELEAGAATNARDGNSDPQPYMMYSWKSIPGYSKFDMYKGNGSADGTFVNCGFRPAFVLMKVTGLSDERWMMYDSKRDPFNFVSKRNAADGALTESSGSGQSLDFVSNGFKLRANQASQNAAGYFYVYMAFAETPFKHSSAR